MFDFFKNLSKQREYRQELDDWVTLLFCGFDQMDLAKFKKQIDYDGLAQNGLEKADSAALTATLATPLIFEKYANTLSEKDKSECIASIQNGSWNGSIAKGVNYMAQIGQQMLEKEKVSQREFDLCIFSVVGSVRNLSRDEILSEWMQKEISTVQDMIRNS